MEIRALVLIRATASTRRFFNQGSRAPVQPSDHLAFTTRRSQSAAEPIAGGIRPYAAMSRLPIAAL